MTYDICNMRCPVCGSDGFHGSNGFRAQVDADAYILRGGITEVTVIDIDGHGDTTCLTCGYNGQIKDFCGGSSAPSVSNN